jgi:hypothetical protein
MPYDRSQPAIRKRVLKEIESAGPNQLDCNCEFRITTDHHDRQSKLPAIDLLDQRSQPHAREINGHKDASGSDWADLFEELGSAVITLYDDRFARKRVRHAAGLVGARINNIDGFEVCGFGHEPSSLPS